MPSSISKALIEKTIDFHGHWCPGLPIGIRASELALQRLGGPEKADWVAVVETDMCGDDLMGKYSASPAWPKWIKRLKGETILKGAAFNYSKRTVNPSLWAASLRL